jgi:isocitrate dehydrogenase (NAD+)
MHRVVFLPGEGIGPEITTAARSVIDASGVKIEWVIAEVGAEVEKKHGTPVPAHVLDAVSEARVAYKGPITTPFGGPYRVRVDWDRPGTDPGQIRSYPSISVALRTELDLYANVRPAKSIPGIESRYADVDLVFFRENTEDLYRSIEHKVSDDIAESIKVISRRASERIARAAFDYAKKHGRRKVTAVHKANIMKLTDGLFLDSVFDIAKQYPDIEVEDRVVDNMCMQLVQKPEIYDVLVLPNLYGDILSDLGAGLIGGLGVAPGANIGDKAAVFEAVHGSAPKYAGKNRANPTATILSMIMMLDHLGEAEAARRVETALKAVLKEGKETTVDLGGTAGTKEMARAVINRMG